MAQTALLNQLSAQHNTAIFLWDTSINRFIYMSDKMRALTGDDPAIFTAENGIEVSFSKCHPNYLNAAYTMNKVAMEIAREQGSKALFKTIMALDMLFRRADGEYFRMLQQGTAVEMNSRDEPLLFLNYAYDITHLKKEPSANLVVKTSEDVFLWDFDFQKNELVEVNRLSDQEKNVLQQLSRGKNSKAIAELLHLSPHTVDTHRRNLLKKTNCIDTTALVTYAKLSNLI
jgi:DNA-binding CsgD family transcriptional regulator